MLWWNQIFFQLTVASSGGRIEVYVIPHFQNKENTSKDQKLLQLEKEIEFKNDIIINNKDMHLRSSKLIKDLRYPNPTLLTHGLIFSSTLISQCLLGK